MHSQWITPRLSLQLPPQNFKWQSLPTRERSKTSKLGHPWRMLSENWDTNQNTHARSEYESVCACITWIRIECFWHWSWFNCSLWTLIDTFLEHNSPLTLFFHRNIIMICIDRGDCGSCTISVAGSRIKACVGKVPPEPRLKSLQEKGLELR